MVKILDAERSHIARPSVQRSKKKAELRWVGNICQTDYEVQKNVISL